MIVIRLALVRVAVERSRNHLFVVVSLGMVRVLVKGDRQDRHTRPGPQQGANGSEDNETSSHRGGVSHSRGNSTNGGCLRLDIPVSHPTRVLPPI